MTMVAMLFGLPTAAFGGRVLFGGDVRQVAGAAVGFVVWFNSVSEFAYAVASLDFWWA